MDWTETKPREEGYYWYNGDYFRNRYELPETLLLKVEHVFDPPPPFAEAWFMVSVPGVPDSIHVDEIAGLWSGPLDLKPPPLP